MATTAITPPWNAWALDRKFLDALDDWFKANPDKKLDIILENVCRGIESGKDLFSLIPDSPFPARSLIQGLGGLVKLGNTVRKAKSSALKFAKQIVLWIDDILKAFQDNKLEQFSVKAWNNLDNVRALVDEICTWAKARLEDRWWSRNTHKFTVESEIEEFQSRLNDATAHFMRLSMINTSAAHDLLSKGQILIVAEIEKAHEEIKKTHEKVLDDIQGLSVYVREKRLQEQYQVDLAFIEKELAPYIASNSGYRDQGKEFCYPGTRLEPLTEIKNWVSDFSTDALHFLWLTGEPGSGKSTIAATVCRDLKDSKCLWAELFINRNYLTTTNPKFFFPSIAFQLAKRSPEVARVISYALQEKPSLIDEVTETLAKELFVKPLSSASQVTPLKAIVVVVDALDETDAENLHKLAKVLSKMTTHLAVNIKVLISSREEEVIRAWWAAARDTKHLSVGTINKSSIEDVESFLKDQIQEMVQEYDLADWPGDDNMQKLCLQASGLFVWATTAIKYIRSQILTYGSECLDDVLYQLNMKGMGDINRLYSTILEKMYSGETDPWALETFRRVVGSIVVLNTPFSLGTLEKILDLRRADKHRPVDVTHFVKQLRTVLVIGTDKITRDTIPHLHKSFFEFVTSTNIRPDLRVSLLSSHKELAPKCVAHSAEVGDSYFHAARSSYRWIVEALLDDDQNISAYLICFSDLEWSNYQHSGEVSSLDTAIFAVTRLIKLTPDLHNEKPQYFTKLCTLYRTRYQRLGNLEDIDSSLQSMRAAVSLIPDGHPDQAHHLRNLVDSIRDRYKRLGELHDLEEGLQYMQMAAALTPEEDPDFPLCLRGLAHSFRDRYKRLGDLTDLEMALENIHRAVELTPQGHPEQPGHLHSLAVSIRDRFQRFGELQDLERAVLFSQEAVTLTPVGHPDLPHRLRSLADSCREKYKRFGDLMDLETALEVIQQAIDYIPEWHPDRAHYLKSLAISLTERYQRLGDSEDSEDSLGLLRECLVLIPEGHPDRPQYLRSLAVSVWDRFHRLRDIHDLEDTLRLLEEAVASTPIGHPDQPEHLQIQAASIRDRYQILGDLQDLEKILQILQEAIDITPEGHPDRSGQLHSLAVSFRAKYQTFGHLQDLDKALQLIHQAVALTPEGHPDLPSCLLSQASFSGDLYGATGNLQDLETAFGSYRKSFTMSSTHPMLAWEAALEWAHLEHRPSHILEAYAAAFDLLPEILWIGKSFHACQNARRQINITEVTSEVIKACIDLSNPRQAVEFLEKGLTTTFVHMQQLKTNFDHLPAHVAENFRQLSFELCSGTARNTKMLAAKRDSLLANIRNQPGFEDFLCPKRYSDLCQASQHGPIVILNSHKEHCDAIVLLNPVSDPLHIPLSEVSLDQLEALSIELNTNGLEGNIRLSGIRDPPFKPSQQSFQEILEWLWTHIVVHIYKALELHDIPNGRLWWLPTGAFKGLPLHAADLSDQYISSYTSNLESLLYLNSKEANHPPRLGIIGATSSQDSTSIQFPGVLEEVTKIAAIVGEANVHCLVGEKATMGAVNLQFQDCSWIHVAGHGNQDLDEPLKSFIQLHDGHLELGAIIRMNLSNPDFAFLATCKSVTRKTDEVDMAGGFNVAGFRGVIGTMWTMDDKDGPVAAESFYTKLFANGRKPKVSDTAQALQLAVRELRDRGVPYRRWVPFIHMGI